MSTEQEYDDILRYIIALQFFFEPEREHWVATTYLSIEVSCECKRPDVYKNMIACDSCDRWMHMECAGLSTVRTNWAVVLCALYLRLLFIK